MAKLLFRNLTKSSAYLVLQRISDSNGCDYIVVK